MLLDFRKKLSTESGPLPLDISMEIQEGTMIGLHGPSGAGKTMLLRCIAGLATPDEGIIQSGDDTWFDSNQGLFIPPQKRRLGFLFQNAPLFPHLSVEENLKFAANTKEFCKCLLEETGLKALSNAYPVSLSGGQRQRIGLIQAMAAHPPLLLLDEPFSALDPHIRISIQDMILKFYEKNAITIILVSHQMEDLLRMSQRVIELRKGKITEDLTREEFLRKRAEQQLSDQGELIRIRKDEVYQVTGNVVRRISDKEILKNVE